MDAPDEQLEMAFEARMLKSIDDRLGRIEDKLTRAELIFAGFLAGPGRKLLKLFGNGEGS